MADLRVIGAPSQLPYRLLAGILFGSAVFSALFSLTTDVEALRRLDVAVAVALLLLSAATWLLAPLVPGDWGLDLVLIATSAMACAGVLNSPTHGAQATVGLGLMVFAVFAAYFRPRRRFRLVLGLMVVGFVAACLANPAFDTAIEPIVIVAILVGVPVMVSTLVGRLRELALSDPLTGALNRRGMDLLAGPLAATARRSDSPTCVGLIDLDGFKAYNDRHGHAAGDDLLVAVATAWQGQLRQSDLLVRYGGDEFAVVLAGSDEAAAARLAARVPDVPGAPCSTGFTTWQPDEDLYAALARADARMFRAKRGHPHP